MQLIYENKFKQFIGIRRKRLLHRDACYMISIEKKASTKGENNGIRKRKAD